ncbi:MAG: Na+/H+ antiporter NhaA [Candidatus Fluviicola riflensis]|nr:MAG: Na+/H+ antiporter NhaA [Candidatus Fluviicola riflensis]OGS86202.1 MAG: Na+/H+ antiporter NhaA [Fluviicola sp. RIFCSPHIGHO2_01_FULL_43_53]OGS87733.1 MAG: Na+/H+ antiporter NhaA [Fluviicola sp. RIFCSPHIGHO2_12_FULL_43_24]
MSGMTKSPIDKLLQPVHRFIHREFTGGIVLFISVIIALAWANSPWSESYHHLWETTFSIDFNGNSFSHPLHVWINDGLMALFFFVIGLELKREFMAGELSTAKKASLPMIAALGGMIVPALIYVVINFNSGTAKGWGIPMATDIAFALALLSLAGKHIPVSVKVFLSALAVADDLGAVLVIAFFYTSHIAFLPLLIALGLLILLVLGNVLGVRSIFFYLIIGIAVWVCFLFSGVHATIAGVLVAFTIPARTKIDEEEFARKTRRQLNEFEEQIPLSSTLTTGEQHDTIQQMKKLCQDAETPLQKIEDKLHPWVAFVIMPLFALSNAGMIIHGDFFASLGNPVSIGIIIGLLAGKFIGVFSFAWLAVRFKISDLPEGVNWMHVMGVSVLAGVGFTMSLFVTGLAFADAALINQAKYGILIASFVAGVTGVLLLKLTKKASKVSG